MACMNPPNKLIITPGSKYGKLTVIEEAPKIHLPSGQSNRAMKCLCECGNIAIIRLLHLVRLRTISCGCVMPHHGYSKSKLYNCWRGMINRTSSSKYIDAHRYIDRGITVCEEWKSFIPFKEWALSHGFEDGLQIDRRENSNGYTPENCRFVDNITNINNRDITKHINYGGVSQSFMLLLRSKGIHDHAAAIIGRLKRGWPAHKAIDTPIRKINRHA